MSNLNTNVAQILDLINNLLSDSSTVLPTRNTPSILNFDVEAVGTATISVTLAALGTEYPGAGDVFSLTLSQLDGGTWDVDLYAPGTDPTPRTYVEQAEETDIVVIDGPIIAGFDINFAGLGGGASPILHIASRSR
jgi:hypothetical protein